MFNRRISLIGLFAVLLALMAQLSLGASMPLDARTTGIDPVAVAGVLCHSDGDFFGTPSQVPRQQGGQGHQDGPKHPDACVICPLCVALHATAPVLVSTGSTVPAPIVRTALKVGLPPPSTAPPAAHRPPSQPRAPPILS
jgi:hypothetical protein